MSLGTYTSDYEYDICEYDWLMEDKSEICRDYMNNTTFANKIVWSLFIQSYDISKYQMTNMIFMNIIVRYLRIHEKDM